VENRPGAGSNIATDAVVRATPDGYSLLLVTQSNAINATLYEKLGFNFIRDIGPLAGIYHALRHGGQSVRGEWLDKHRRAQEHICRHHRNSQQDD
jgi:hypothetical protein